MLDLSNLMSPPLPLLTLHPCDASMASPPLPETLDKEDGGEEDPSSSCSAAAVGCKWSHRLRFPISTGGTCSVLKKDRKKETKTKVKAKSLLADHVRVWTERRVAQGFDERDCSLPFLTSAPKTVVCRLCTGVIYPNEGVLCSVRGCQGAYHRACTKQKTEICKSKDFKCPQHACFICKQKSQWRCVRCTIASHTKCAPWPEAVLFFTDDWKKAVCWRHHSDWRLEKEVG